MPALELKPTHKPVQSCYAALRQFDDLGVSHEGAVKSAFHGLLDHCARQHDWTERTPNSELRMTNGGQTTAESQSVRNSKFVTRTFPARRNIIAAEIEKVMDALASQSFSRAEFLKKLDRFYLAIEHAAAIEQAAQKG